MVRLIANMKLKDYGLFRKWWLKNKYLDSCQQNFPFFVLMSNYLKNEIWLLWPAAIFFRGIKIDSGTQYLQYLISPLFLFATASFWWQTDLKCCKKAQKLIFFVSFCIMFWIILIVYINTFQYISQYTNTTCFDFYRSLLNSWSWELIVLCLFALTRILLILMIKFCSFFMTVINWPT